MTRYGFYPRRHFLRGSRLINVDQVYQRVHLPFRNAVSKQGGIPLLLRDGNARDRLAQNFGVARAFSSLVSASGPLSV